MGIIQDKPKTVNLGMILQFYPKDSWLVTSGLELLFKTRELSLFLNTGLSEKSPLFPFQLEQWHSVMI